MCFGKKTYKEGTVLKWKRVKDQKHVYLPGVPGVGITDNMLYLWLEEDPETPVGILGSSQVINRIKKGERVKMKINTKGRITWIRPKDRKLKWWQF